MNSMRMPILFSHVIVKVINLNIHIGVVFIDIVIFMDVMHFFNCDQTIGFSICRANIKMCIQRARHGKTSCHLDMVFSWAKSLISNILMPRPSLLACN